MKKTLMLAMFLATGVTLAAPIKNSNISLGGGVVAPAQTLKISLNKFVPSVAYNVTCTITDPDNVKNQVIMATNTEKTVSTGGRFAIKTSKATTDLGPVTSTAQYQLQSEKVMFTVTLLTNAFGSLNFINADQMDAVAVDCNAVAS